MRVKVTPASTVDDQRQAPALLKKVYKEEFKLDFDEFKIHFPLAFKSVQLVIRDSENELLGTASIMEPVDGLFPSEYIFGAQVNKYASELPLTGAVEIGRLAKSKDAKAGLVTRAIMLATMDYLILHGHSGWVATVKSPLYRVLRSMGLKMIPFSEYVEKEGVQAEIVRRYKGDHVDSFFASTADTIVAFGGIARSSEDYSIEILL